MVEAIFNSNMTCSFYNLLLNEDKKTMAADSWKEYFISSILFYFTDVF